MKPQPKQWSGHGLSVFLHRPREFSRAIALVVNSQPATRIDIPNIMPFLAQTSHQISNAVHRRIKWFHRRNLRPNVNADSSNLQILAASHLLINLWRTMDGYAELMFV